MALARLGMICLDCADPVSLAAFWAALLGGEATPVSDDVVVVGNRGTPVAALRVPGYQPPTWPGGTLPKQMHLDLEVRDLDAAEAEAVRLGARRAKEQPRPTRWRVMLDPAGHPFCLCDWTKELLANRRDGAGAGADQAAKSSVSTVKEKGGGSLTLPPNGPASGRVVVADRVAENGCQLLPFRWSLALVSAN